MADKYVNAVGVQAIKQWIEGKFATLAGLSALSSRVDDIIAEGGEPNVIETVKVNGIALTPDSQKAVNVDLSGYAETSDIPTDLSDLTNTGQDPYATQGYVDQNGGKIDSISVNGVAQTIDANKNVDITVPEEIFTATFRGTTYEEFASAISAGKKIYFKTSTTTHAFPANSAFINSQTNDGEVRILFMDKIQSYSVNTSDAWSGPTILYDYALQSDIPTAVSDLTNDSNFQTDTQVDSKIASAVASAVTLKGSVATYSALPTTGQKHGDLYDVLDTGKNYVWLVEEGTGRWDDYAGTIDMSAYWTSTTGQTNTLEAMTVAEINAILEPSA